MKIYNMPSFSGSIILITIYIVTFDSQVMLPCYSNMTYLKPAVA